MAPASDGAKKPLGLWPRGQTPSAIGAPSAGLSLGGLRARRAHLRFTRRVRLSQEQSPVARPKSGGYDKQRVLNCGANGEFLLSLVGKSYCRWTGSATICGWLLNVEGDGRPSSERVGVAGGRA